MVGLLFAFRREAQQTFKEAALLQGGTQNFHHRGITVALESGSFFAQTAKGSQCRSTFDQVDQNLFSIGTGVAFAVDHPAGRQLFAFTGVNFDLATLADTGGTVQEEGEFFIGGNGKGKRVGAQHVFHAESGSNGGAGVGAANTDHVLFDRHKGVVSGNTEVSAVTHHGHTQTKFFSSIHGIIHSGFGCHHTHTVVSVDNCRGGAFADPFDFGDRLLDAVTDAVDVNGLEPSDTVGVDTQLVGSDQHIGTEFGIFGRHAGGDEDITHETFESFKVNVINFF